MKVGIWYECKSTFNDKVLIIAKRISNKEILHHEEFEPFISYEIVESSNLYHKVNLVPDGWIFRELTSLEVELL